MGKWYSHARYNFVKKIANHFDVTIDYLLDNVKEIPIKKNYFKIKLNCNSGFSVFTDKDDNPNISMPDPSYHRCDSLLMFKASDDQNKNILAINQFGKIIYAGYGLGYGYASPSDKTYYDGEGNLADKECFILKDNFVFFKDRFSENQRDKYKIITKKYNVTINSYSSFAIFSDYKINDTIAMTSYSSSKRHRCLANESYKVSDNPDDIIIAIDKDNKIIYMTNQSGYGYGSPSDNFYMANKNKEDLINKCFILNNNFQYYKKGVSILIMNL